MKNYGIEPIESKKIMNKNKIIISILIAILIILIITLIAIYSINTDFRKWIDKNVLRKEVMQDTVATIELNDNPNSNIYAFNKYIGILNKNKFQIYGNSGKEEKELEMQITNPLFDSENRFLAVAEKKGQKLYVLADKEISWETEVEGKISQVHINKNGYVAVVIVDTSDKTEIAIYAPYGEEKVIYHLSSARVVDVSISNDNKYLAIGEIDTTGTVIQSNIKIMSIEKAETDPTNSLYKTYQGDQDKLLVNIKYQDKDKLICMYTDSINIIENESDTFLSDNKNKKVIFQSIKLDNNAIIVEERSSGIFSTESTVSIINVDNKSIKEYVADSIAKEIYTNENIIALNLGTQIEFINTDGWLVKRYVANQEISNIVVSNNMAGIIYKDKIEIVNL